MVVYKRKYEYVGDCFNNYYTTLNLMLSSFFLLSFPLLMCIPTDN